MKTTCLVWRWQGKSAGGLVSSPPAYSAEVRCQGWRGRFVLASRCLCRPFCILHSSFFLRPRVSLPPILHSTFCILPSPRGGLPAPPPMDVRCSMFDVQVFGVQHLSSMRDFHAFAVCSLGVG